MAYNLPFSVFNPKIWSMKIQRKFMELHSDNLDFLRPLVIDMFPTGSRVICNPPVLDTDEDWVILCASRSLLHDELVSHGYDRTSKKYYRVASSITTYRHKTNDFNLIVTDDRDMFDRWREATEIATQENLTNKEDRIKLFELITGRNNHLRSKPKFYRYTSTGLEPASYGWFGTSTTGGNTIVLTTDGATYIGET